jgi:hypothetical protein
METISHDALQLVLASVDGQLPAALTCRAFRAAMPDKLSTPILDSSGGLLEWCIRAGCPRGPRTAQAAIRLERWDLLVATSASGSPSSASRKVCSACLMLPAPSSTSRSRESPWILIANGSMDPRGIEKASPDPPCESAHPMETISQSQARPVVLRSKATTRILVVVRSVWRPLGPIKIYCVIWLF